MSEVVPIKAHQQNSLPLLRRPRPPKPVQIQTPETTASKKTTPRWKTSVQTQRKAMESQKNQSENSGRSSHIHSTSCPHPTPFSMTLTPYTPYTPYTPANIDAYTDDATSRASESTIVIYPLYPRGPPGLPPGKILKGGSSFLTVSNKGSARVEDCAEVAGEREDEAFTLDDFRLSVEECPQRVVPSELQQSIISRENYLKLTGWFATHVPKQDSLNTVSITVDHEAAADRKPRHQILLELRAMILEAIEASGCSTGDSETPSGSSVSLEGPPWPLPTPNDVIVHGSLSRYFCGEGRSNSPFDSSYQPLISPDEAAIVDCMMHGGSRLSLKAHFLTQPPDLAPLAGTLTYLNLSFNNLRVFPAEILELRELVCLKMRNNPVREIPSEIRRLQSLEILCVSFSLLSDLPSGLFELPSLVELDASHNSLQWLSRDISKLRKLRHLNLDGNQLSGLPSTALSLPLTHLTVTDNLMHPLLWADNTRNQPQPLVDISCTVVSRCVGSSGDPRLPGEIRKSLQSHSHGVCDCCGGSLFGSGLRLIRSVAQEQFRTKNLPFIFTVCSPGCRTRLKRRSGAHGIETVRVTGT